MCTYVFFLWSGESIPGVLELFDGRPCSRPLATFEVGMLLLEETASGAAAVPTGVAIELFLCSALLSSGVSACVDL